MAKYSNCKKMSQLHTDKMLIFHSFKIEILHYQFTKIRNNAKN